MKTSRKWNHHNQFWHSNISHCSLFIVLCNCVACRITQAKHFIGGNMRKALIFAIALFVFITGFAIAQSDEAKAVEMDREIAQVQQDLKDGKITDGQAMQRTMEIMQRYMNIPGTATPQQRQTQQGAHSGWPQASLFQGFQYPVLTQPSGTTASFNYTAMSILEIFIRGGNTNAVIQDLVRQVNSGTKSTMSQNNGAYTLNIERSGVVKGNLKTTIEQKDGVIVFVLSVYN